MAMKHNELAQLRSAMAQQQAEIEALRSQLNQLVTRSTSTTAPATPEKRHTTSRRRLLKQMALAASAAAGAVALSSQNALAETSAPTPGGQASTQRFGFSAAPQGTQPFVPLNNASGNSSVYGLIGRSTSESFPLPDDQPDLNIGVLGYGLVGIQGIGFTPGGGQTTFPPPALAMAPLPVNAGVRGDSSSGVGIFGFSDLGYAIQGYSNNGDGIFGATNNSGSSAIHGSATQGIGVTGDSGSNFGGIFTSTSNYGGVFGTGSASVAGKAQILLRPRPVGATPTPAGAPTGNNHLSGELYASRETATSSNLYFCVNGDGAIAPTWVKLNKLVNNQPGDITIQQGAGISVTQANNVITIANSAGNVGSGVTNLNGVVGGVNLVGANGITITPSGQTITIGNIAGGTVVNSIKGLTGAVNVVGTNGVNVTAASGTLTIAGGGAGGGGVTSLNGKNGVLTLQAGTGVTLDTSASNAITINATGGGGGASGVTSLNGKGGTLTLQAGTNVNLDTSDPNAITINAAGGVASVNGKGGALNLQAGAGIALDTSTPNAITINSTAGAASSVTFLNSPIRVALVLPGTPNSLTSDDSGTPNKTFKDVQITGVSINGVAVPAGAKGIIASLTSVGATSSGNLRLWPSGGTPPNANTLNIPGKPDGTGFNLTSTVVAGLGTGGKLSIGFSGANSANCGYAIDVIAYL